MMDKSKHGRMGAKRAWRWVQPGPVFLLWGTAAREHGALECDLG